MITREEFSDWRTNPVTRAFMAAAEERVQDAKDILAGSAGIDPNNDNYFRGFVGAYAEMQGFRVEDTE